MDISTTQHGNGVTEIGVTGRLNMVTAARVRDAIQTAVESNHPRVAVDLSGVVFLDSSGLGALIAGLKTAREAGGDVRLVRPTEQVDLVLDLTNMGTVLKSFDSVESAYPNG
ncbi:MAG TPA: STAS domain-containing protein [Microcella sp.]|nr:STAS domain-containing protein [Microcella sp.]